MLSVNFVGMEQVRFLEHQAASLLLYQSVLETPLGATFLELLAALHPDITSVQCLRVYGRWVKLQATYQTTWQSYLIEQVLTDENPFSCQCQHCSWEELSPALIQAAQHDLWVLKSLYECGGEQLSRWVQAGAKLPTAPVVWQQGSSLWESGCLPDHLAHLERWEEAVKLLANHYSQKGAGIFARYDGFQWRDQQLVPVSYPDPIQLTELVGYEHQRETLCKNTEFLLAGYPALHVLLYGSRGSGKSSLVKSLLNHYGKQGLRLIEVGKSDLKDLPIIVEYLRGVPQKFIIFVDDLSFEEDDDGFKSLKVLLEGSLTARPKNVVVYATSNRRHLVREFFAERPRPVEEDEVHSWDTVQEKLSFSDRFGLTLTFTPADQPTYLKIVEHLARVYLPRVPANLEDQALQWATRHNGRSGRTARQFIDFLQGELGHS